MEHVQHIPFSTILVSLYDVVGFIAIQPTKKRLWNYKGLGVATK